MNRGQETLSHNQSVFRRANERLLAAVGDRVDDARPLPFLCECLDPACRGTVQLTIEQFRELRDKPNLFAIVTGHLTMDDERVVAIEGEVTIVEKAA